MISDRSVNVLPTSYPNKFLFLMPKDSLIQVTLWDPNAIFNLCHAAVVVSACLLIFYSHDDSNKKKLYNRTTVEDFQT